MKKTVIALGLLFLMGVSTYTVYNYNKSNQRNINNTASKDSTSLAEEPNLSNNNLPSSQENINTTPNNEANIESAKIEAIDFKLKDFNGKEVSLSDYKGKKIFLNFWASWCPPCIAEMPEMEELYQETKDSDLVILAVNLSEGTSPIQKFMDSNKYNFQVLFDTDNVVASKYQIVSIPTSFFIDKEGNIAYKHIGSMTIEDMKNYINDIK